MVTRKQTLAGAYAALTLFGAGAAEAQTAPTPVSGAVISSGSIINGSASGTLVQGSDVSLSGIGSRDTVSAINPTNNGTVSINGSATTPYGGYVQLQNSNVAGDVSGTAFVGSIADQSAIGNKVVVTTSDSVGQAKVTLGGVNGSASTLGVVNAQDSQVGGSLNGTAGINLVASGAAVGNNSLTNVGGAFFSNAYTVNPTTFQVAGSVFTSNTRSGSAVATAGVDSNVTVSGVGDNTVVLANKPVVIQNNVQLKPAP